MAKKKVKKAKKVDKPSTTLSIEVSLASPPSSSVLSAFTSPEPPTAANISKFRADPGQMDRAVHELRRLGFRIMSVSRLSISVEGTESLFAKVFGTKLESQSLSDAPATATPSTMSYLAPAADATWAPPAPLEGLVERAYIQEPFLYFESPIPPRIDYHHLRVPGDLALLMNAAKVHREGTTGRGVKVAMIDSGFFIQHPYYQDMGYNMSRMLAPGASNLAHDESGHGTAEAANILAMAPAVTFIGVKTGPNLTAAFKETVRQNPGIISISLGFDLRSRFTGLPLQSLPGFLRSLEQEIADAVSDGITVVVSAGNGHISFPGMHPDVISAGGAYIDEKTDIEASDYASAFASQVFPGRQVPDVAGLVGLRNNGASYIMLPLEGGDEIDTGSASDTTEDGTPKFPDGTSPDDGWAVISGTSAAAPQLAGVCALLKEKNPSLTPSDLKALLKRTARDVARGQANEVSNPRAVGGQLRHVAIRAGTGPDGATGHGLVDAFEAWKQA